MKYEKMNNLFLRQSYLDSWEDYERSLKKKSFIKWDYIILTASNKAQATAYRNQIENRLEKVFFRKRQRMRFFQIRRENVWDPEALPFR